jgi:hypothetical protein
MKIKKLLPIPNNFQWIKKGKVCYHAATYNKGIIKSNLYTSCGLMKCDVLFENAGFVQETLVSWIAPSQKGAKLIMI